MNRINLILIALLLVCNLPAKAHFEAKVWRPTTNGGININPVSFTDPEIEITPKGIYAEVSLVFSINAPYSAYTTTDSLETVIDFDLPPNSFVHDSWLWLDETNIIRAEIVEKLKAQEIYNNLVTKIRRDPSILIKTGPYNYNLRVWPLKINYPRKVKIVYSVPFEWNENKFSVPLPVELFKLSKVLPDLKVKIINDMVYHTPSFIEMPYSGSLISSSIPEDEHIITAASYSKLQQITLSYTMNNNGIFFALHPTSNTEGIYEIGINTPMLMGSSYVPKNVVFIVDHYDVSSNDYNSTEAVKEYISTFLQKHYNSKDSFNIFYMQQQVASASSGWIAATPANINTAISAINTTNAQAQFTDLLKQGLAFCATKPGDAQTIIISANKTYKDKATADPVVQTIESYLGGSFPNKIHTINNTISAQNNGSLGSQALLFELSSQSGGRYSAARYYIDYTTYKTRFILDVKNILYTLLKENVNQTNAYSVDMPFSGFTHSAYDIAGSKKLSTNNPYFEIGKYYGTVQPTGDVKVQYVYNGILQSMQQNVASNVLYGSEHYQYAWVNRYIMELMATNTGSNTQEIIDSSKNNRVLCDSTAFLALDNGDTIVLPGKETVTEIENKKAEQHAIKIYPNPFTEQLTIEFEADATELAIYDVMGRLVYARKIEQGEHKIAWNGKDNNGNTLSSGMYIIVLKTADSKYMHKVLKQ
jgi:hypothetical protein